MAVAAYACVLSLLRVVDSIQQPSRLRFFPDKTQVDALQEKLCSLQDFFEVHSSTMTNEDMKCIVRKIPRVTNDAEILIDNYVVDQLYRELYPQNDVVCGDLHDEIPRVIQQIESIKEELTALRTIQRDQEKPARVLDRFTGDKPLKNKMVGFDDQLNQVLEKLTGKQSNLMIVPIVGMGGIGKTTLARSLFDHPYNLHHFQVRIWLTISQDYSLKKVLQGLYLQGVVLDDKKDSEGDESEAVITKLYQKLFGQRYLIVLDDVWSTEVWYDLKRGFPDNGKGSRVMVTTRLSDIVNSFDSGNNNAHSMKFLDEDKSWDLVNGKAFEQGVPSLELEEIGREISKGCKGLPLLLVLIGGLLANSDMSVEYWQNVNENINSFANSVNDEYCLRIVSLSYHHLPIHLKPCFLCMRHFEEDSDVEVSELIKTWVSRGYVKPSRGKSMEEAARKYMEDLVARNMFLIRKRSKNGNIKICGIHDLLRNLSIKESEEQFSELPKIVSVSGDINGICVICNVQKWDMKTFEIPGSVSDGKILVCSSCESKFPEFARSRFVMAVGFQSQNVPLLTRCRWIALYYRHYIYVFHTLHLIWNLEILDIKKFNVVLPKELWEMAQLRRVKVGNFKLRDPVVITKNDVIVLENLQTFTRVENFKFTEDIVRRMPNLRKLGLWYDGDYFVKKDWSCFYLQNLAHLQKLESLLIISRPTMDLKKDIYFPCSLKKLTLEHCKIAWDDVTIIGLLPNLEVLKLCYQSVIGDEWNPSDGEFVRLKYLKLVNLDLVHWNFDETPFPALETLALDGMDYLDAIPQEIGDTLALNSIYLNYCNGNIIDSAKVIVDEQQSNGNEGLVVHVQGWNGQNYQISGTHHVQ